MEELDHARLVVSRASDGSTRVDMIRQMFVGIDVGTSGVRVLMSGPDGTVIAQSAQSLRGDRSAAGRHEQSPEEWWIAVCDACRQLPHAPKVAGIAVTSTSGTLVVAGAAGEPLRPAIMYDDGRSASAAQSVNSAALRVNASYSLAKAIWVRHCEPEIWERTRYLLHPADWLAGKLCGQFGISDYTSALKLGYDVEAGAWSPAVARAGIPCERLPTVVRPGECFGHIDTWAAAQTGLTAGTPVIAGASDGIASLIASGARRVGDANTTLGSTLVWKVLTSATAESTSGVYCHLHPGGFWAPGAASNSGPGSMTRSSDAPPAECDALSEAYLPSRILCYALPGRGERFPYLCPDAETFFEGKPSCAEEAHATQLQSIAFVERWGYEVLADAGARVQGPVYSAGAAAQSPTLSRLRANILNKAVTRCRHPVAAFGAAVLAATGTLHRGDVLAAIQAMAVVAETYEPSPAVAQAYGEIYRAFRDACRRRGYGT